MGFISDILVRIRGDKSQLDSTLKEGGAGFKGFAATITAAAAAGAAAFAVLINWAKETDFGVQAINVTLGVTKQLLTDALTGQGLHLKEAIANAKAQSKIKEDEAKEGYQVAKMQAELNKLIVASADQTLSHKDKLGLLTKAMEKEREIKAFLLEDAKDELKTAWDIYKINQSSTKAREDFWNAEKKVMEVQGMDSRRIMSSFSGELANQKKRAYELVDAFTELPPVLDDIKKANQAAFVATGQIPLPQMIATTEKAPNSAFTQKIIPELAGAPKGVFDQGMADAKVKLLEADQLAADAELRIETFKGKMQEALLSLRDMAIDAGIQLADALGQALGGGDLGDIGKGLLSMFASILSQFGAMLITMALGSKAFIELLKFPGTWQFALVAGAAMVVAGGAIKGMLSKSASKASGSGGSSSSSSGMGTATATAAGDQTVEFKIAGTSLVGVLNNQGRKLSAYR